MEDRTYILRKASAEKVFATIPAAKRKALSDACLKKFGQSPIAKRLETGFAIVVAVAGLIGLIIGTLTWGFGGAIGLMAICVFGTALIFAIVFRWAWLRWMKTYSNTNEFQEIVNG